jgi:NAD-dependent dihydropyrimidine dehydrogenase PreA subunit
MLDAIKSAWQQGKGIYLMKALGGGHLLHQAEQALGYAFGQECAASVAVGMQTRAEIDYNVALAGGLVLSEQLQQAAVRQDRHLHIEDYCEGCGQCAGICPQGALALGDDGKMHVTESSCLLCSYCAGVCPNFCIKVF